MVTRQKNNIYIYIDKLNTLKNQPTNKPFVGWFNPQLFLVQLGGMFQAASETRLPAIGRLKAASQGLVAQSRMRPRHMDGCDYIPDFSKEFL